MGAFVNDTDNFGRVGAHAEQMLQAQVQRCESDNIVVLMDMIGDNAAPQNAPANEHAEKQLVVGSNRIVDPVKIANPYVASDEPSESNSQARTLLHV
ncbi:hypothetical protein [Bradyrhizobium diazoefficiens]